MTCYAVIDTKGTVLLDRKDVPFYEVVLEKQIEILDGKINEK